MGAWDYSYVGYICSKNNEKMVKELLTCMGIDFKESSKRYSELGAVNRLFSQMIDFGMNNKDYKACEIYAIANKLFDGTTILYAEEDCCSDCDAYYRREEVYDHETNKKMIAEIDYSYDGRKVFGERAYDQFKEEIEEEARKRNIKIEWDPYYRDDAAFDDLIDEIISEHGGLRYLGTRESIEDIPEVNIDLDRITKLIDNAAEGGYDSLVDKLKEAFDM